MQHVFLIVFSVLDIGAFCTAAFLIVMFIRSGRQLPRKPRGWSVKVATMILILLACIAWFVVSLALPYNKHTVADVELPLLVSFSIALIIFWSIIDALHKPRWRIYLLAYTICYSMGLALMIGLNIYMHLT